MLALLASVPVHAQPSTASALSTEAPPLKTDRPGFNAPALVQDPGVFQIEMGWSMSRARDGSTASSGLQPLLRYGLVPRVEVQVASAGLLAGCAVTCAWRRADVAVGARVILPTERLGVNVGVTGLVSLPTGHARVTSNHIDPTVVVHVDRALTARLGLGYNVITTRTRDDEGAALGVGHGLSLGYSLGRFAPFTILARRAVPVDQAGPWLVQVGTAVRLGGDVQVDVSVDRGLTGVEPAWGVSAGVVLRRRRH